MRCRARYICYLGANMRVWTYPRCRHLSPVRAAVYHKPSDNLLEQCIQTAPAILRFYYKLPLILMFRMVDIISWENMCEHMGTIQFLYVSRAMHKYCIKYVQWYPEHCVFMRITKMRKWQLQKLTRYSIIFLMCIRHITLCVISLISYMLTTVQSYVGACSWCKPFTLSQMIIHPS